MSTEQINPPAIGSAWTGQGGIYAGIIPARNGQPAYHLIIGEEVGRLEWGPYGIESSGISFTDGQLNTSNLLGEGDEYFAVIAAADYQADGHSDFYLPAIAELTEAWMNLGDKDWGCIWSSTQRSAQLAYSVPFVGGGQSSYNKNAEFCVRPVRKVPIQ